MPLFFAAKSMAKNSKGDSSNDPKASTDSSTTIEDDDSKGQLVFFKNIVKILSLKVPYYSFICTFWYFYKEFKNYAEAHFKQTYFCSKKSCYNVAG